MISMDSLIFAETLVPDYITSALGLLIVDPSLALGLIFDSY